eukprot:SAG22_NODE_615_length_8539_cov_7.450592_4_plen_184_part_00
MPLLPPPGRFREPHGFHRPVCAGRWLVSHVGFMNMMPVTCSLVLPAVLAWLPFVPFQVAGPYAGLLLVLVVLGLAGLTTWALLMTHLTEPGLLPTRLLEEPNMPATIGERTLQPYQHPPLAELLAQIEVKEAQQREAAEPGRLVPVLAELRAKVETHPEGPAAAKEGFRGTSGWALVSERMST